MAKQHNQPYRLFKRGDTYHAYFSCIIEGRRVRIRETCRTNDEAQAIQYCLQRLSEIQQQIKDEASGRLPRLTLDEAFSRYMKEKGQYLTLPKQRLSRLIKLKKELKVTYLDEIKEPQINRFITSNRQTLSNSTINRYLFLLSAVIRTATEEWAIATYPLKLSKFKLKEPAENIKFLSNWQIAQKIIDRAADHLKPIIYTALYTGMRESNILSLKWENIDFIGGTITIKVKDKTKQGGKNHSIPIIPQLAQILHNQPKVSDFVFTYKGNPIKSIMTAWRNIFYKRDGRKAFSHELKDPELPYINFHALRHTAATWILRKTNNLRITKEILGHANINTTLKYAHVLDDEKRKALNTVFDQ